MSKIQSIKICDPGLMRQNEDFVASYEPTDPSALQRSGYLYIVADGVGGAARGERASEYAARKVMYEYYRLPEVEPGDRLRQIISQVNTDIFTYAEQNFTRMATTLVAAVFRENTLTVANVGDSRAYLIRDGETKQITRDHTIAGQMLRDGSISEVEARASKGKNRLFRSLGGESEVHVDIFQDIPLQPGDKILLCSDGLSRYALKEDISRLTSQGSLDEIARKLIDFANECGGEDNISVILVAFDKDEAREPTTSTEKISQASRQEAAIVHAYRTGEGKLFLEIDGERLEEGEIMTPEQRRRLVKFLIQFRPWLEATPAPRSIQRTERPSLVSVTLPENVGAENPPIKPFIGY